MRKRGKVLRAPGGPGLLMIDGQQYWFSLGDSWKSEVPPKPGLVVDVELDRNLQILGITPVLESRIVKEQAKTAVPEARKKRQQILARLIPNFVRKRRM